MLKIIYLDGTVRLLNLSPSFFKEEQGLSVGIKIDALVHSLGIDPYLVELTREGTVTYHKLLVDNEPLPRLVHSLNSHEKQVKKDLRKEFKRKYFEYSTFFGANALVSTYRKYTGTGAVE